MTGAGVAPWLTSASTGLLQRPCRRIKGRRVVRVGAGVLGNWHAVKQEGRQAESHTNGRASMKESTGVHRNPQDQ